VKKLPTTTPLKSIITCCLFIPHWGQSEEKARGLQYLTGLAVNVDRFPVVWKGWTLRLYFCKYSLHLYHPTTWSRMHRLLKSLPFVELVEIDWTE
jgi:hypothetical protein